MAKSRRNVSRRKRQQKRRNSRRNFRKMLRGGGLVDNFTDKELNGLFQIYTEDKITNTINRLRQKNSWDDFIIDYPYGSLISHFTVERILQEEKDKKEKDKDKKENDAKHKKETERIDKLKDDIINGNVTELNEVDYRKIKTESGSGPSHFWGINWVLNKDTNKYIYKEPTSSSNHDGWVFQNY